MQDEFERVKELMTGAKVRFPKKLDGPDEVGTVTDVFFQPAIDLSELGKSDEKDKGPPIYESEDERPYPYTEYAKGLTQLKPKTLCRVQFSDCVHITEPKDLVLV